MSEKVRSVLRNLVEELKLQEAASSIGLFGSWSRGDAVSESDVDVLIVDKRDFNREYIERIEFDGLLIDLNYIPQKWLVDKIPTEIDQKIYEAEVLYDRDQRLTRTKKLMEKTYWTHERVDLRTESYLIDAYTYLSRATSAQNKGDFRSSRVYAVVGLESILKTLIEVNMRTISNSHFIEALESSAKELDMQETFRDYLEISKLSKLDRFKAESNLSELEKCWNDAMSSMQSLDSTLKILHTDIKRDLAYYGKSEFLRGLTARSRALIDKNAIAEAGHYISRTLLDMLENYAWLALATKGSRFDYTTLFDSLANVDSSWSIYERALKIFGLQEASTIETEAVLKKTKEMTNDLRQRRKELISKHVKAPT